MITNTAIEIWKENIQKLKTYRAKHGNFNIPAGRIRDKHLAQWVDNIRLHPEKLPQKTYNELIAIGFDFSIDSDWNTMFLRLEAFYQKHGNSFVPPFQRQYEKLFDWTVNQRNSKSLLSKDQIKKLASLDFEWIILKDKDLLWQKRYKELVDFKLKYGHTRVPSTWQNKSLAGWVAKQRENEASIVPFRKKLLQEIGFYWYNDMQKFEEQTWLNRYQQLKSFYKERGHFKIPSADKQLHSLRIWVTIQRRIEHRMPGNHKKLLDAIKFPWKKDIKANEIKNWLSMYNQLLAYYKKHKDCQVSSHSKEYSKLGAWVFRQRRRWNALAEDQRQKLKAIKFSTSQDIEKQKRKKWLAMLAVLQQYKAKHGHCRVPSHNDKMPELGRWVEIQRLEESKLPAWKKECLNTIGFDWSKDIQDSKVKKWYGMYANLEKFYKRFGHSSVPEYWKKDQSLSVWVMYQRKPKLALSKEKIKLLKKLSFKFKARTTNQRKRDTAGRFINEV